MSESVGKNTKSYDCPHCDIVLTSIWEVLGHINRFHPEGQLINRDKISDDANCHGFYIKVPSEVARNSLFPFKEDDRLNIKIDPKNKSLVIEKKNGIV